MDCAKQLPEWPHLHNPEILSTFCVLHQKIFNSIEEITSDFSIVIAIGQFDGVHIGHQKIFTELRELGQEENLPTAIWTFCRLIPKAHQNRLAHPQLQLKLLKEQGINELFKVKFVPEISELSAEQFLDQILIDRLRCRGVVLGENAQLAKDRSCTAPDFLKLAKQRKLKTRLVQLAKIKNTYISSSAIREQIKKGDLKSASDLLGRPYLLCGEVISGQKRGRELGFPTANIHIGQHCTPPHGVYACQITFQNQALSAIAYIGTRPTLHSGEVLLEVHIPNWQGDLYHEYVQVELKHFIRGECKFSSEIELREQIQRDIQQI